MNQILGWKAVLVNADIEGRYSLKNRSSTWSCWAAPVPAAPPQTAAAFLTHFLLQAVFYLLEKREVFGILYCAQVDLEPAATRWQPSVTLCLAYHLLANRTLQGFIRMTGDHLRNQTSIAPDLQYLQMRAGFFENGFNESHQHLLHIKNDLSWAC